ncbi:hypothetical protein AC249_AIPGENE10875 [Exaiptasia diaphana]|nr:hypothetical protein AC249_AIPGENE10875 [Exaiptasia diaphana]
MSEINVRLASRDDCKDLVDLLHSEKNEELRHELYTTQSIQNILSSNSNRIFVAEEEGNLCAVVVACVVDGGTSLVIKDAHIGEAYYDSDLVKELLTGVYMYLGSNFRRIRTERFVASSKKLKKLFEQHIKNLRTSHLTSGKFTKVFQLEQLEFEIDTSSESFVELSNIDTIFANGEYLLGEKQTDQRVFSASRSSLKAPSPSCTLSGRKSPSRLHSSHMVNVLENLHTSLRSMSGCLQSLEHSLQDALPKSFSHGKQLKSRQQKTWEAVIYCEDSEIFRGHALEQLRAASLHSKTKFKFIMNYHSAMFNEASKLFTEELALQPAYHETKKVEVYERQFEFSVPNGVLRIK